MFYGWSVPICANLLCFLGLGARRRFCQNTLFLPTFPIMRMLTAFATQKQDKKLSFLKPLLTFNTEKVKQCRKRTISKKKSKMRREKSKMLRVREKEFFEHRQKRSGNDENFNERSKRHTRTRAKAF